MQIVDLAIKDIVINSRRRSVRPAAVDELVESITQIGLLQPVTVNENRALIAGLHRVEAAKRLGWQTIPAHIKALDDLNAELAEIDENLKRNELTALEQGEHLARRKEIYEALPGNENTRRGVAGAAARWNATDNASVAFTEDTAAKTGVTARTVYRDVKIGRDIAEDVRDAIRDTPLADSKMELLELARLDEAKQKQVTAKILQGEAKSVKDAQRIERQEAIRHAVEEAARNSTQRALIRKIDARKFIDQFEHHSIDLLITDPPYSTDVDDITHFAYWLLNATPKLKSTGRAYICIGPYPLEMLTYLEVLRQARWLDKSQILVWTYRNTLGPSPSHQYKNNWQAILYLCGRDAEPLDCPIMLEQFSVQDISAPDGRQGNRYHAWQKPDELAERLIRHSTKPGDLVVDPFAGTGTFLLAAAKLNRQAVGADISDESLSIARQRGCDVE